MGRVGTRHRLEAQPQTPLHTRTTKRGQRNSEANEWETKQVGEEDTDGQIREEDGGRGCESNPNHTIS